MLSEPSTESMKYAKQIKLSSQELLNIVKHVFSDDECCVEVDRYVYSIKLKIHGYVDAVVLCSKEVVPIEIKLRSSSKELKRYALHHVVQLVSYAIAAEEVFKKPVYRAIIISLEPRSMFEIKISSVVRELVYRFVKELHKMIENEKLPTPTPHRNKCSMCFYNNVCVKE